MKRYFVNVSDKNNKEIGYYQERSIEDAKKTMGNIKKETNNYFNVGIFVSDKKELSTIIS